MRLNPPRRCKVDQVTGSSEGSGSFGTSQRHLEKFLDVFWYSKGTLNVSRGLCCLVARRCDPSSEKHSSAPTVLQNYIPKLVATLENVDLQSRVFFTWLYHIKTGKHTYLELTVLFSCLLLAVLPVWSETRSNLTWKKESALSSSSAWANSRIAPSGHCSHGQTPNTCPCAANEESKGLKNSCWLKVMPREIPRAMNSAQHKWENFIRQFLLHTLPISKLHHTFKLGSWLWTSFLDSDFLSPVSWKGKITNKYMRKLLPQQ